MKLIFVVIVYILFTIPLGAESYIYCGKYMNSSLLAAPGIVNDYATARAGIHIEDRPLNDIPQLNLFAENEVLIDEISGASFNPASSNFKLGFELNFSRVVIILQHECRHPFEMRSSISEEYNLLEFRYKINSQGEVK